MRHPTSRAPSKRPNYAFPAGAKCPPSVSKDFDHCRASGSLLDLVDGRCALLQPFSCVACRWAIVYLISRSKGYDLMKRGAPPAKTRRPRDPRIVVRYQVVQTINFTNGPEAAQRGNFTLIMHDRKMHENQTIWPMGHADFRPSTLHVLQPRQKQIWLAGSRIPCRVVDSVQAEPYHLQWHPPHG
ncbi:hypothetical protein EJ03DRAFT_10309 [Teratosphaeria nubilosa]|uniref:Uncharacterized protein n=1 Tax=Teratosphaeria nubilosa TaxID=161662 RepID=A0A6G1LI75_9PEZI|nr:hypothetical protein EJ03DRAFT_10309 [Teratosphaeria nubilosa]